MWSFFSKDPSKDLVNYDLQEQVILDRELEERTIWTLNNAKKKGATVVGVSVGTSSSLSSSSSSGVGGAGQSATDLFSSFSYVMKQGNESCVQYARNGFKRMKMLRHPNILMYQDGLENDKCLFIVTERVQPLFTYLKENKDNDSQKENEISWGLFQIATSLNFLNNDCKLVHNNVCMSSIVINRAGEWKLTGFEYTHAIDDSNVPYKFLNSLKCYDPPEKSTIANNNRIATESGVDSWSFGCLIWEIFNGLLPNVNMLKNIGKVNR